MFVRLIPVSETEKAYRLENGSYIPKSVLDGRGLTHPYYRVEGWWLQRTFEKFHAEGDPDARNKLAGLEPLVVQFRDIPEDVRAVWDRYWRGHDGGSQPWVDMEPRLWGNDCFEGEMSSWF